MRTREERIEREARITAAVALGFFLVALFVCGWLCVALHFVIKYW